MGNPVSSGIGKSTISQLNLYIWAIIIQSNVFQAHVKPTNIVYLDLNEKKTIKRLSLKLKNEKLQIKC